jgi:hypothetical protein
MEPKSQVSEAEDMDSQSDQEYLTQQPTQKRKILKIVKPSAKKTQTRGKSLKKDKDLEMNEDDSQIDSNVTMSKSKAKAKAPAKKASKNLDVPKIGEKRTRAAAKPTESEDENESVDELEVTAKRRKVKSLAGKEVAEKVIPQKVKKQPKKPTVYKRGKWNPDVEIIDKDPLSDNKTSIPVYECCKRCN